MLELEFENYRRIESAFADLIHLHGSVAAVLSGAVDGRVFVDNPERPGVALLEGPEGVYLGGSPGGASEPDALRDAIDGWAYLYPGAEWLARLDEVLPHRYMLIHERVRLAMTPLAQERPVLPAGFDLVSDDGSFSFVVLRDGETVSSCAPDMVVDGRAEIGVWTHGDFRRRGLALAAAEASLSALALAGVTDVAWHCHASNRGSLELARRLGFSVTHRYQARSASLPAENPGDLDVEQCRALGRYFEEGAKDVGWLDFHAAAGWAQAGEKARAIAAVERLVNSDWKGEAGWLEDHWAFADLLGEARFIAAVAQQRAK